MTASQAHQKLQLLRARWAAVGAAVAVTLGAAGIGIGLVSATSPTNAVAYVPITPCRLADTRPGPDNVGPRTSPLGANDTHTIFATGNAGRCIGVPTSATGVQLNVTTVRATDRTFLTVWATGNRPTASSLNPSPGQAVSTNAVTTELGPAGQFNVYNRAGTVELIVDLVGYYVDHNHDDRYYTAAEVDTLVDAKPDTASVYTRAQSDNRFLAADRASTAVGADDGGGTVGAADRTIASVTVDTPTTGVIIANATTSIFGIADPSAVHCSIATGTSLDANFFSTNAETGLYANMAATRSLDVDVVPGGGSTTLNLVCNSIHDQQIGDSNLTAIFVPDAG